MRYFRNVSFLTPDSFDRPEESGVLIARVDVELFRHLRLTLDGRISGRDYNAICLRIGFAIGGGHSR